MNTKEDLKNTKNEVLGCTENLTLKVRNSLGLSAKQGILLKSKMNTKAKFGDILMNNIVYLIVLVLFFVGMLMFVQTKMNGASVWEDFYAKEIAKMIDVAEPGDFVTLDVRSATKIASSNKIGFDEIFSFDNSKNEVCVKLSAGGRSCFSYISKVNINSEGVKLLEPVNVLRFSVEAKT